MISLTGSGPTLYNSGDVQLGSNFEHGRVGAERPSLLLYGGLPEAKRRTEPACVGPNASSGRAFFKRSKVTLKVWRSRSTQVDFRNATTDERGHFDLGSIDPGKFRLLAEDARGFKQPDLLSCRESNCTIDVKLFAAGTDTLESICPAR